MKIKGSGRILIRFLNSSHTLSLEDYLFIPNIGLNPISTSKLKSNTLVTPNKALMFSNEGNILTISQQVKGLYYLPVQVQNQALVLQESRKRKVSFEPSKQPSKRAKIDLESLKDIQGILERADQALEKAKRLEEALIKANKAVQQAMPKEKTTKEVKEVKRAKRATLSLWHQRLGHISEKATRFLLKDIYRDELAPNHPIGALEEHFTKCEPCIKASLTNKVSRRYVPYTG